MVGGWWYGGGGTGMVWWWWYWYGMGYETQDVSITRILLHVPYTYSLENSPVIIQVT